MAFQIDTYNKTGEVVGDPTDAIRFFVEDPKLVSYIKRTQRRNTFKH